MTTERTLTMHEQARERARLMTREVTEEQAAEVRELMSARVYRKDSLGWLHGKRVADEVMVQRAVDGVLWGSKLNIAERREAFAILSRFRPDLTVSQVADRLGCSTKTVQRYRAKARAS